MSNRRAAARAGRSAAAWSRSSAAVMLPGGRSAESRVWPLKEVDPSVFLEVRDQSSALLAAELVDLRLVPGDAGHRLLLARLEVRHRTDHARRDARRHHAGRDDAVDDRARSDDRTVADLGPREDERAGADVAVRADDDALDHRVAGDVLGRRVVGNDP